MLIDFVFHLLFSFYIYYFVLVGALNAPGISLKSDATVVNSDSTNLFFFLLCFGDYGVRRFDHATSLMLDPPSLYMLLANRTPMFKTNLELSKLKNPFFFFFVVLLSIFELVFRNVVHGICGAFINSIIS